MISRGGVVAAMKSRHLSIVLVALVVVGMVGAALARPYLFTGGLGGFLPAARARANPTPAPSAPADARVTVPLPPASPASFVVSTPRVESHLFTAATLHRTMPYYLYLPPGYDSDPAHHYPVLYMLHGASGENNEWITYDLFDAADRLIHAGAIQPLLIVLPQGDEGYWVDHADGGPQWGKYVADDVVGEVDTHYRTVPDRAHRAIGGLSMGAHGALQLGINYPDVFGIIGAHSPTLHDFDTRPPGFGDTAYFAAHDPLHLYMAHPDVARTLTIWVDVGEGDQQWRARTEAFHKELQDARIPHTFHEYPGGHTAYYWGGNGETYLRFYTAAFVGKPGGA